MPSLIEAEFQSQYDRRFFALAASATCLDSRDNDLLALMRWETMEGRAFQKRFRLLKIVGPVAFLNEIEARSN